MNEERAPLSTVATFELVTYLANYIIQASPKHVVLFAARIIVKVGPGLPISQAVCLCVLSLEPLRGDVTRTILHCSVIATHAD